MYYYYIRGVRGKSRRSSPNDTVGSQTRRNDRTMCQEDTTGVGYYGSGSGVWQHRNTHPSQMPITNCTFSGTWIISEFKSRVYQGTVAVERGQWISWESCRRVESNYKLALLMETELTMQSVCPEDLEQWFLPQHPVLSPHKPLPKIVFDSAAVHGGVGLKDCLKTGTSLNNGLSGILMHFHERSTTLADDVSDMFHHVCLHPEDCKYHCYLWQDMETDTLPDIY